MWKSMKKNLLPLVPTYSTDVDERYPTDIQPADGRTVPLLHANLAVRPILRVAGDHVFKSHNVQGLSAQRIVTMMEIEFFNQDPA